MKNLFRLIVFLIIFFLIFMYVSGVSIRKETGGEWNMTIKVNGFFNEEANSFDVMGFGSSHMYCAINPLLLNENTGIKSYILATQKQPIWMTYHYIKEALVTQKPKVVIVDLFMTTFDEETDEAAAHSGIDYFRWSKNKMELIDDTVLEKDKKNYYINFLKYHSRWSELKESDFDFSYIKKKDWLKGYVFLKKSTPIKLDRTSVATENIKEPTEKIKEYLQKLIELSKQEGFELLFIVSPYKVKENEQEKYNYVKALAKQENINFIDFNLLYDEININENTDFYDERHINYLGTEKVTQYLGQYLIDNFGFEKIVPVWNQEYGRYASQV